MTPQPPRLKHASCVGQIFFGIGAEDEVARPSTTQAMHAACSKPKQLKVYPGAGHELVEAKAELQGDTCAWVTRVL